MKPLRLWARNLRTWAELELEVPAGIVAVVGPNGAGKSSLVNVIDLALFGGVSKEGGVQIGRELRRTLTRQGPEDTVEVGLDLEHAGEVYRVRRSFQAKGNGKPRLDLERARSTGSDTSSAAWAYTSLTRETVAETQAELERILGLTRRTFRASSYLAQDDGAAFTQADPRERKAILLDALGVSLWDRLKAGAAERRTAAERDLNVYLATCERLEGELALRDAAVAEERAAGLEYDQLGAERDDIEAGLRARRGELEEAQAQAGEAQARHERARSARFRADDLRSGIDAKRRRIHEAEASANGRTELVARAAWKTPLEDAKRIRADREGLAGEAARLEQLAATVRTDAEESTTQVDELVARCAEVEGELAALDAGRAICPTCRQVLHGPALAGAREALRARLRNAQDDRDRGVARARGASERAAQLQREASTRSSEARELLKAETAALELLPDIARGNVAVALMTANGAERELAVLDEREDRITEDRAELTALEDELPMLEQEADAAEAYAAELTGVDLERIRERVLAGEAALSAAGARTSEAGLRYERAKTQLERLDQVAEQVADFRRDIDEAKDSVGLLKLAERAYGRDGIPALILEASAIPQLEAEANRIIGELGRTYRFELRTLKETQAGTVKEALDIVVFTDTGEAAYEDFSGGERTRLDLALRIALARLLATRRGTDVRLLAIDEPAYLDDEGFDQLARVLRGLESEFETVLVVSHVDALRDAFDSALVVAGGGDTGEPSRLDA